MGPFFTEKKIGLFDCVNLSKVGVNRLRANTAIPIRETVAVEVVVVTEQVGLDKDSESL